jgi:hypothetical protein
MSSEMMRQIVVGILLPLHPCHRISPKDEGSDNSIESSKSAKAHLLTIANVCALSFSAKTELVPCMVAMISRASRSSRVCPGRLSHAFSIHLTAYRVRCFSLSAMGREITFPPWECEMQRTEGAARSTAWRTTGSGGARVRECTQRSTRETMREARLRFPWRMIVFVMN